MIATIWVRGGEKTEILITYLRNFSSGVHIRREAKRTELDKNVTVFASFAFVCLSPRFVCGHIVNI